MSAPAGTRTQAPEIKSHLLCQLSYGGSRVTMLGHPDLPPRFWAKVDAGAGDGCWLWTGAVTSRGYGCFVYDGRCWLTHRLIYTTLVGTIPDGYTIDHLCRVKTCVNPAHLEPVTLRENIARALRPQPADALPARARVHAGEHGGEAPLERPDQPHLSGVHRGPPTRFSASSS